MTGETIIIIIKISDKDLSIVSGDRKTIIQCKVDCIMYCKLLHTKIVYKLTLLSSAHLSHHSN